MSGPAYGCEGCGIRLGMAEAVGAEMRCPGCGVVLVPLDGGWLAKSLLAADSPGGQRRPEISRLSNPEAAIRVARLLLPSVNDSDVNRVRQFFGSLPLPVSLEYLGAGDERHMLLRAAQGTLSYLAGQISASWPRARLEILDIDPAVQEEASMQRYSFWIGMKAAPYLPLKTWDSYAQGDPVLGVFASMLGLAAGEKLWLQFHLSGAAAPEWLSSTHRRLKAESQRGYLALEDGHPAGPPGLAPPPPWFYIKAGGSVLYVLLGMAGVFLGLIGEQLYAVLAVLAALLMAGMMQAWLSKQDNQWLGADLDLVRKKVIQQDQFILAVGRLTVWSASPERARQLLERCLASLAQYALAGGNALELLGEARQTPAWLGDLAVPDAGRLWLTLDEASGLWHPPVLEEGMAPGLVPVREVEIRAPAVEDVRHGYQIGSAFKPTGGENMPVRISQRARQRGIFLIGKSGTGKSSVMEHLVQAAAQDEDRPAIVVIDPHGDMADRLLGVLGQEAAERIVYMNMGDDRWALTFNPLDPHATQMSVEDIVSAFIDIGQAIWKDFWGPRMQMPLQRTLTALAAANMLRQPGDLLGPALISTLLESDNDQIQAFIEANLGESPYYKYVTGYFYRSFVKISRTLREQIIQPVLSKGYRFQDPPIFHLFSAPESKLNLREILDQRKILIVNTKQGSKGRDLSAFLGALIVNWIIRMIALQGETAVPARTPLFLLIDEFQGIRGVPWEVLLGQMRKFGMQVVLGTQNFAGLRSEQSEELPGIILGGVRTIVAFEVNGEDAHKLASEEFATRAGGPSAETLINLEEYTAYVKTVSEDGRRVAPFLLQTAKPLRYDPALAARILDRRRQYSAPIEIARRDAENSYEEIYGKPALVSAGAGSGRSASARQRMGKHALGEAAHILLGGSHPRDLAGLERYVDLPRAPGESRMAGEGRMPKPDPPGQDDLGQPTGGDESNAIESDLYRLFNDMLGEDDGAPA